ncbi:class I SAM-dependent methyltransferase [Bacillus sp. RG28]|uniref:Class I SAM-dependent methyltransferase n=1 Tax=Gottfriedia endophytica TaxID=2820819 RepID=A0A940NUI6_9BACI|nr:class I SAM-dependent methyltransferase [Gottfriedia endophytica]MBP0727016.1 class I SAM-dependent methyltransferase [Gottfriedia endophytica]
MEKPFFEKISKDMYTKRSADDNWKNLILQHVDVRNKSIADIGCGGGIYSIALSELGAQNVIGIDQSKNMLEGASGNCKEYQNIKFQNGSATETNLKTEEVDVVLERALIHHIKEKDLINCFNEAKRILNENGQFIIQDRTKEDCLLNGDSEHIRGYFLEFFPKLVEKDISRRHASKTVNESLIETGFKEVKEITFWEYRKTYYSKNELKEELLSRNGRSLLFHLNDNELNELANKINEKVSENFPIIEKERWTIWIAQK